jgi:hypothetical protein
MKARGLEFDSWFTLQFFSWNVNIYLPFRNEISGDLWNKFFLLKSSPELRMK